MQQLPTREEIFAKALAELDTAYRALGDAQDWLRSDWQPVGSSLSNEQGKARSTMRDAIAAAKNAVNQAKEAGHRGAYGE